MKAIDYRKYGGPEVLNSLMQTNPSPKQMRFWLKYMPQQLLLPNACFDRESRLQPGFLWVLPNPKS